MNPYPDRSFLASLYLVDAHSPAAVAPLAAARLPLPLTEFGRFELLNAPRGVYFRGSATADQLAAGLRAFHQDLSRGVLAPTACDWPATFAAASRLSARFTAAGGPRALDVLHVAAARQLGAVEFLSFDPRQRALSVQVGLTVRP